MRHRGVTLDDRGSAREPSLQPEDCQPVWRAQAYPSARGVRRGLSTPNGARQAVSVGCTHRAAVSRFNCWGDNGEQLRGSCRAVTKINRLRFEMAVGLSAQLSAVTEPRCESKGASECTASAQQQLRTAVASCQRRHVDVRPAGPPAHQPRRQALAARNQRQGTAGALLHPADCSCHFWSMPTIGTTGPADAELACRTASAAPAPSSAAVQVSCCCSLTAIAVCAACRAARSPTLQLSLRLSV